MYSQISNFKVHVIIILNNYALFMYFIYQIRIRNLLIKNTKYSKS